MKKSVLWYIAICAGAVSFTACTVLVVMYGRDIYACACNQVSRLKSAKDKVLFLL